MKQFTFILTFATSLSLTASMVVISYVGLRVSQLLAQQPPLIEIEAQEEAPVELKEAA